MIYSVYILTNIAHTVLYTGVTNNLEKRTNEHIFKIKSNGFAEKYNCNILVYYEQTSDINIAIEREKQIKGMTRYRKEKLINSFNPEWENLMI